MKKKNRYMGFHAIYGNLIKKNLIKFIYFIIYGPLFQTSIFRDFITASIIDPFKIIKLKINNVDFVLNISSYTAKRMINEFNSANTENKTQLWLKKNLKNNDVFMDVGGNIGAYIIYVNKLKKLKSSIAIEASSINTKELIQNIYLNNLENKNINVIHAAAGDENKLEVFDIPNVRTADGHGKITSKIGINTGQTFRDQYGDHSVNEIVNLRRLDDIFKELNWEYPNIILMDIDAHEVNAMKGMKKILSSVNLRAFIIEVRKSTYKDVHKIITSYGFKCDENFTESVGNLIYTKST